MSIGINSEEMHQVGSEMQCDRALFDKLKPMIVSYRKARDNALNRMHEYEQNEIIYAQFRGKFNVYNQIIEDLLTLVPPWLSYEIREDVAV